MTKSADEILNAPINILLVEDSTPDAVWVEELMRTLNVKAELHVANDGVKAVGFLNKDGVYADMPVPDLVILDLNMPRMGGMAVLDEMNQEDSKLKNIPVVILSGDKTMIADFKKYEELAILGNFKKPIDPIQLDQIVKAVTPLW